MLNLMVFSKHLAGPPLEEAAGRLRAFGIEALDLTVRPGGHVLPEQAQDRLPAVQEMLRRLGMRIGMLTTNITDAADPATEVILRTAASLGIRHVKLGYWEYAGFGALARQRKEVVARVKDLAAMCDQLGVTAGFHNHSDAYIGASLWDIEHIIRDTPPRAMGLYLDPAHATIEGGSAGWELGMDLLAERIVMLAVKDFLWVEGKHRYAGGRRHSVEFCPLEEGNTPWPQVLRRLRQIGFDGPISFHSEYQGRHSFADLSVDEVIAQTGRDVELFRRWWDDAAAPQPAEDR
jgi:sugar phosphate isomerase/epimerase